MKNIEHVAVIGAGIMGGHISAFFANLGISCDIYDIDLTIVKKTLAKLSSPKTKPPVLYSPRFIKKITPRHVDDMEKFLNKADLIVEAVPERMDLKKKIFAQVEKFKKEDSIVVSNTSGLSINKMASVFSEKTASQFLGIHFFNPVRFLPLVEIIPAKTTDPALVDALHQFLIKAGKKVVICRDTPNFIANRLGIFTLMSTLNLIEKYKFDTETIDMITGTPLANPKTATLRLCDLVGIDTILEVARNVYENCPEDECREMFKPPAWLEKMVENNMLGEKSGKGFYQKTAKREILALDMETLEYRQQNKPKSPIVRTAKGYQNPMDKIRAMCDGNDPIHRFSQEYILRSAMYGLNRVGEIADNIKMIDDAVKWGFRRDVGPIEVLDAIGLERARHLMKEFKIAEPAIFEKLLAAGSVYRETAGEVSCFDIASGELKKTEASPFLSLKTLKAKNKVVRENPSARLIDLDDGILLMELDHKMVPAMNPVDEFVLTMFGNIPDVMAKGNFKALVIGNQGPNFCAGAQLQMIMELAKEKQWQKIEQASANFQMATMSLYHANFPVVVAPHNLCLGGGMEIVLSGHKRVAWAEFYGGLVEVGVGLLPGAAGNLLLLMQFMDLLAPKNPGPMPPVSKTFELIAYGTVSNSAFDAIDKGLLTSHDIIIVDKEEQISRAKQAALEMVEKHQARPLRDLYLPGPGGYLALEAMIDDLVKAGKITEHSALIAKKQAYVLTGGSKASITTPISEMDFLALEREAFVQLCREPKSQARIAYMLKNKKPLFN